jgi:murein tripeptide amidase MpaA
MHRLYLILLLSAAAFAQAPHDNLPNASLLEQPPRAEQVARCPVVNGWSTPAEKSCYRTTPRYEETMAYVRRIALAAPRQVRLESFGKTGEGRALVAVVVSGDGVFAPAALHAGKRPVVFIQNAIHAGEMDGKDASLALLRDILITKKQARLIDRAVLVIVPIYNADGHEHFGPFNRINQNGPEQMGWRANATHQNLNRDYLKADAPETRGFLREWQRWLPDFFVDNHVTDGADYQYDVTFAIETDGPVSSWVSQTLEPELFRRVAAAGHVIAPYLEFMGRTPDTGIANASATPRFSTGLAREQNRPGMLVEMHMLKDYQTRVTGNYEVMRALLEVVNRDATKLVDANRRADRETISRGRLHRAAQPLKYEATGATEPFDFKGYRWKTEHSEISGAEWVQYTHEPVTITVPKQTTLKATVEAKIPAAYIIPAQWTEVISRLELHGLRLKKLVKPWTGEVDTYRCRAPQWQEQPFEGRHLASWRGDDKSAACTAVRVKMSFAAGSVVVPMDQRAARVAMQWLEPLGPDSALQWGLFDSIFEQKEYGEDYVLERLARKMLEKDAKLKAEFEQRVAADPKFAASPRARLNWFYERSAWWDERIGLYPVGKVDSVLELPVQRPPVKKEADEEPDYDPEIPDRA